MTTAQSPHQGTTGAVTVYCSGPLFCPEELAVMTALSRALESAGYATFLPHRNGLERYVMGLVNTPLASNLLGVREQLDRAIFAVDVYQLARRCDVLVCNLNGRVPDEGAAVEAGVAFALGKPVVLYCNDRRSAFMGRHNAMLLGLSPQPAVADVHRLAAAVAAALRRVPPGAASPAPALSGDLARALRHGERLWRVLDSRPVRSLRGESTPAFVAELLAALAMSDARDP